MDVVQSVKPGPTESTGRGVAVIGVTSRVVSSWCGCSLIEQDTLLLLEKRVKSRFSHRMWRISSPLSLDGIAWREMMKRTLIPWDEQDGRKESKDLRKWKGDWQFAVEVGFRY